jgi:hypothetical protein
MAPKEALARLRYLWHIRKIPSSTCLRVCGTILTAECFESPND